MFAVRFAVLPSTHLTQVLITAEGSLLGTDIAVPQVARLINVEIILLWGRANNLNRGSSTTCTNTT